MVKKGGKREESGRKEEGKWGKRNESKGKEGGKEREWEVGGVRVCFQVGLIF